jgi:putative SOS response-associated peptidase YedK
LKPYRIRAWPVRKGGDPVNIETFSFLTTTPNPLVATINHERMPVILTREEEFDAWLLGSLEVAFARAGGIRQSTCGLCKKDLGNRID